MWKNFGMIVKLNSGLQKIRKFNAYRLFLMRSTHRIFLMKPNWDQIVSNLNILYWEIV